MAIQDKQGMVAIGKSGEQRRGAGLYRRKGEVEKNLQKSPLEESESLR